MNFNKFLIIPVLALFSAITACGNNCKSICEDKNGCAGVTTKEDCDSQCDKFETLAEDANCGDKYDDAADCEADKDDQCNVKDTSCQAEETAFAGCIIPYCQKAANAEQCKAAGLDLSAGDGT